VSMIQFRPIGVIRTPFADAEGMPIQAGAARNAAGRVLLPQGIEFLLVTTNTGVGAGRRPHAAGVRGVRCARWTSTARPSPMAQADT
jgi:hypothetical protein